MKSTAAVSNVIIIMLITGFAQQVLKSGALASEKGINSGIASYLLIAPQESQTQVDEVDSQLARQLRRRQVMGDTLTGEEQGILERWLEMRRKRSEPKRAAYRKEHPPRDSTGLIPLVDLQRGVYRGMQGGLYPGGQNTPPASHLTAGLAFAQQIVPRDVEGRPAEEGRIGLLAIGMSNTTAEFQAFRILSEKLTSINPKLIFVDGAQGSRGAPHTAKPDSRYWDVVDERLTEAGVAALQVQAVWLKQVKANPKSPFPDEVKLLQDLIMQAVQILKQRFVNLQIVYLSSRIYAGYAETRLHPEPHAYETGFAIKWLIEEQITGHPELNFDPAKGTVQAPLLMWGPYLWADGLRSRSDALYYRRADLDIDGIHPSASGRQKVARQLVDFFSTDPTTRSWFLQ